MSTESEDERPKRALTQAWLYKEIKERLSHVVLADSELYFRGTLDAIESFFAEPYDGYILDIDKALLACATGVTEYLAGRTPGKPWFDRIRAYIRAKHAGEPFTRFRAAAARYHEAETETDKGDAMFECAACAIEFLNRYRPARSIDENIRFMHSVGANRLYAQKLDEAVAEARTLKSID